MVRTVFILGQCGASIVGLDQDAVVVIAVTLAAAGVGLAGAQALVVIAIVT